MGNLRGVTFSFPFYYIWEVVKSYIYLIIDMRTMLRPSLLISLLVLTLAALDGQVAFPGLVVRAFGSDQELINGIQLCNQYWQFEGHPYFLDGRFRAGSVCINNQRYEQVMLRYNLYSQKVEIDYRTVKGNQYQFMSVAEHIPSFSLDGLEFRRMQFQDETPGYYQVITVGKASCYICWKKDLELSHNNSSRKYEFNPPKIRYWLKLDQQVVSFHNRKTFIETFPVHIQKEISKLLKQRQFSFKQPTAHEAEAMIKATLRLYEMENLP